MAISADILVINALVSAGAGLFGVGVGWGIIKTRLNQISENVKRIQQRQARLRGEDNGGLPLYVTRDTCLTLRDGCGRGVDEKMVAINANIAAHTSQINGLTNFARWFLQDKGLTINEINKILEP